MRAARKPQGIPARETCPSHPELHSSFDDHEPLPKEMRCAYCGERLAPERCGQCGHFMTAREMHDAYFDGAWRCMECQ